MLGPVLTGTYVRLEPSKIEHAELYTRWSSDLQVIMYMDIRNPLSHRQQIQWLEDMAASEHDVIWMIVVVASGQIIGETGLHRIDWRHRHAYSRLLIGEHEVWGKGFASEAIQLRTAYAFRELGLEKVMCTVHDSNHASRHALEKAGYRQCGLLQHNRYHSGRWHDEWMGEVLRSDWEALNAQSEM